MQAHRSCLSLQQLALSALLLLLASQAATAQQCGNTTRYDKYFLLVVDNAVCNYYRPGDATLRARTAGFPLEAVDCILINGTLPGPTLRVTKGDWVRVDVQNAMPGREVAIHFHGLHVKGTPWADGTGHVNACPVGGGSTRTTIFQVQETGTYLYHGHAGTEEHLGVSGAIIVDNPRDPHINLYDAETPTPQQSFQIRDWWKATDGHLAMRSAFNHYQSFTPFGLVLVNGLYGDGRTSPTGSPLPLPSFGNFAVDTCYRLRFIMADTDSTGWAINITNSATGQPVNLTVIALTGRDNHPVNVHQVVGYTKQRVDAVFCTAAEPTNYTVSTVQVQGQNGTIICNYTASPDCINGITWTIRSSGAFNGTKRANRTALAAAPFAPSFDSMLYPEVINQTGLWEEDLPYYFSVTQRWNIMLGAASGSLEYMWDERMFSLAKPSAPPLFTGGANCGVAPPPQPGFMPTNANNARANLVKTVRKDEVVDIVFDNLTPWSHPIHLHGATQWVLGMRYRVAAGYGPRPNTVCPGGNHKWSVPAMDSVRFPDANGAWPARIPPANVTNFVGFIFGCPYGIAEDDNEYMLDEPFATDIVQVPAHSWAIVRVKFDNPGVWHYHCHLFSHQYDGMGFFVHAGMDQLPKIPSWVDTSCAGSCPVRNQVCGDFAPRRADVPTCAREDRNRNPGVCQPFPPTPIRYNN